MEYRGVLILRLVATVSSCVLHYLDNMYIGDNFKDVVVILHVGMTAKQDGGYMYTQWTRLLSSTELSSLGQDVIHSPVAVVVCG